MDTKNQVANEHRSQQTKYIYYLIALAVACIGYSVHSTSNEVVSKNHIAIGIAVLAWVGSVVCGLLFLKFSLSLLYDNYSLFRIRDGEEEITGKDPSRIQIGIKVLKEIMEKKQGTLLCYAKWQEYLLGIGGLSFLVWHIIRMFSN